MEIQNLFPLNNGKSTKIMKYKYVGTYITRGMSCVKLVVPSHLNHIETHW